MLRFLWAAGEIGLRRSSPQGSAKGNDNVAMAGIVCFQIHAVTLRETGRLFLCNGTEEEDVAVGA
jgi:hypothetical protein